MVRGRPANLSSALACIMLAVTCKMPALGADRALEAQIKQAEVLIKSGRFQIAADRLTSVLKRNGGCADAFFDRATCYLHLMRFQDAIKDCDSAIAIDKSDMRYFSCRGYAHMKLRKLKAGIADYKEVLKFEPGNIEAKENIRAARDQLKREPKIPSSVTDASGREWYRKGLVLRERGETASSLDAFQHALQTIKSDPTLYFLTAKALLTFERFDEAIDDFDKGLKLAPDNRSKKFIDARYWRAAAYANKKHFKEALAGFDEVLKLDPKNYDSLVRKADIYTVTGEKQRAIDLYERFLKLRPEQDGIRLKRADLLMEINQPAQAIGYYQEMVNRAPDDEAARERRGRAYLKLGQFAKAVDDLSFAIAEDPDSAAALYLLRAQAYAKLGKNDLAAADRKRAAACSSKQIKKPL